MQSSWEDGIPIEVFKASRVAREMLFELVKTIWKEEEVPEELVVGLFITIFKNKGSSNDFTKYRFICLLNHAFKLLSSYLLRQFMAVVDSTLPETQAGFRKFRSTRDNIFVLAELIDEVLMAGNRMVVVFIDFVSAFDTVSHHFLDEAMGEAELKLEEEGRFEEVAVLRKCRAVFRSIYARASGCIRHTDSAGNQVFSSRFQLCRGVVQGDIFSPAAFIFALAVIMRRHGENSAAALPRSGEATLEVKLMELVEGRERVDGKSLLRAVVESLEYADDAALLQESAAEAEERVTRLAVGAELDADMEISKPKTECLHVSQQSAVSPVRPEQYKAAAAGKGAVLKFKCEFCSDGFDTHQGLEKHKTSHCREARRCTLNDGQEYEVEAVLDARGPPDFRYYLVRWAGCSAAEDSWESWRLLLNAGDAVDAFWAQSELNKEANIRVTGEHRCVWCCKLYTGDYAERSLKSHHTKKWGRGGCRYKPASKAGSRAEKAVKRKKLRDLQNESNAVHCCSHRLENVLDFKYLGHMFSVDGGRRFAMEVRMGIAKTRFGQLARIWESSVFPMPAKLRLFEAAVVSVLVYGCEAWFLDNSAMRALTGWCAKCMVRITGREIADECREPTFPITMKIRQRRLRWIGHVIRMGSERLVRVAVMQLVDRCLSGEAQREGTVLMDVPPHKDRGELVELAGDRMFWNSMCNAMCKKNAKVNKTKHQNISAHSKAYMAEMQNDLTFRG